jgi:Icc-related predicted phosphoesterase
VKIACISDLHGKLPKIEECDLLLIAGDICGHATTPGSHRDMAFQANWLDTKFRNWLNSIPAKHVVAVAGNHDFVFQDMPYLVPTTDMRWTYLLRSSVDIDGLKIWGTPDSLPFYDWSFNVSEENLKLEYQTIPPETDIIVSHGPPYGLGDLVDNSWSHEHTGSESFTDHIKKYQPQLVVVGHIHSAYGEFSLGPTKIINASVLDEQYQLVNVPIYAEINPRL